jgi:hypothetical protein
MTAHNCAYQTGSTATCACLLDADHQENDVEQFWNGDEK